MAMDWQRPEKNEIMPGTLYLVSTPIGNLRDISLRALDILCAVDVIAAEDTRTSRILLTQYGIRTPLISYHDHNESSVAPQIVARLQQGQSVALISDAGTPGISDPGFYLVRAAVTAGLAVIAIPGATAFVPALIISGLPCDRFVFEGFLPHKKGRRKRLEQLCDETRTLVFYESPQRIEKLLHELYEILGDRPMVLVREISKKFEQTIRGNLSGLLNEMAGIPRKGEFVVLAGGAGKHPQEKETTK